MSSTLYDFIRDTESLERAAQDDGRHRLAAGQNRGDVLDQTGLEVDTEIDFLDT